MLQPTAREQVIDASPVAGTDDPDAIWRALANPIRRRILDLLRDGPRTTGALAERFPELSRFAVMQHLGVLEEAGLVLPRRQGRSRFNYLNAAPLRALYERWVNRYAGQAAGAALGLKRFVEQSPYERAAREAATGGVLRLESELRFARPCEAVFEAATAGIDCWWPFRQREGGRVRLEPQPGARLLEEWDGGGALIAQVVWWQPPLRVCFGGFSAAAEGFQFQESWEFEPDGEGCYFRRTLALWGAPSPEVVRKYAEEARERFEAALRSHVDSAP